MIGGLPIGFAQPLVLLGLLSLPVLWWLLRLIPPRPRKLNFPPARLLFDIVPKEETPARTPWWLTAVAAWPHRAGHHRRGRPAVESAGRDLERRQGAGAADRRRLVGGGELGCAHPHRRGHSRARRSRQPRGHDPADVGSRRAARSMQTPGAARVQLRQIKPKPHTVDRMEALPAIARFVAAAPDAEWVWLSDGVEIERGAEFVTALAKADRGQAAHHCRGRHAGRARARRRRQRGRRIVGEGPARRARSRMTPASCARSI